LIREKDKIKKADLASCLIEDENNFVNAPAVAMRKQPQSAKEITQQ
jgi:hypothetical protein